MAEEMSREEMLERLAAIPVEAVNEAISRLRPPDLDLDGIAARLRAYAESFAGGTAEPDTDGFIRRTLGALGPGDFPDTT